MDLHFRLMKLTASHIILLILSAMLALSQPALQAPPPASTPADPAASSPVFVGAGDISSCKNDHDEETASLLDGIEGTIFTLGDHVYKHGTAEEFANCYAPTWGRHRERTRPSPGNHDYETDNASAYFDYFGAQAGAPDGVYYSFDLGAWHIISLNTNCDDVDACKEDSPQVAWLREDLAAHPTQCTLAFGHHPLVSSGKHGNNDEVRLLWTVLYEAGVDIVLSGHDHDYERFAPQNPNGGLDAEGGIRLFIVGTGGAGHYDFEEVQPNSEVRDNEAYGVLKLTLNPTGYDWEFVPIAGDGFTDTGSDTCH